MKLNLGSALCISKDKCVKPNKSEMETKFSHQGSLDRRLICRHEILLKGETHLENKSTDNISTVCVKVLMKFFAKLFH